MGFKKTTEGRVFFQRTNRGVKSGVDLHSDGGGAARQRPLMGNDDMSADTPADMSNDMFNIQDRDSLSLDIFSDDSALYADNQSSSHIRRSPLTGRELKMGKPFEIKDAAQRSVSNVSSAIDANATNDVPHFEIHDQAPPLSGRSIQANDVHGEYASEMTAESATAAPNFAPNNTQNKSASIGQDEILGLLKSLNDRLKTTKADRDRVQKQMSVYRALIEGLESKSEQAEKAYESLKGQLSGRERKAEERAAKAEKIALDTRTELEKTRALLNSLDSKNKATQQTISALDSAQKKQAARFTGALEGTANSVKQESLKETTALMEMYETLKKQVVETAERQTTLGTQVGDALSQQASLVRKIDKVSEDRARFMRKIERIEETVLQTRDALSAIGDDARDDIHMGRLNAPHKHDNAGADLPQALLAQSAMRFDDDASAAVDIDGGINDGDIKRNAHGNMFGVAQRKGVPFWKAIFKSPIWTLALAFILGALLIFWFSPRAKNGAALTDSQSESVQLSNAAPSSDTDVPAFETTLSTSSMLSPAVPSASSTELPIVSSTTSSTAPSATLSPTLSSISAVPITPDTLDINDSAALLAAMENDPDAVARALNAVAPMVAPANDFARQDDLESTFTIETPAPLENTVVENKAIKNKAPVQKNAAAPHGVLGEAGMPEVIRNVEAQALNGSSEAQHDLGAIYVAGHAGVAQDYERAAYWFEQAANQNVANAAYNLGVLHHQGLGVKADIKNALTWYEKAADLSHPEARYNLGIAYIEGVGVPYNAAKAAAYFKGAANDGIMEAAYNLGLIYENGLLGQTLPDDALVWYKAAADKGSAEARAAVEQLGKRLEMSPSEIEDFLKTAQKKTVESEPVKKKINYKSKTRKVNNANKANSRTRAPKVPLSPKQNEHMITAQIQEYLYAQGLFPGPADGALTPQTRDAIRTYQSRNALSVNGAPDADVLHHMMLNES